ncbi:MAG: glutathione S-transferase C-terminal domain-containing protein, partial [Acidobacteria bacterium]|nr:glutathione S-transferase C-terminal domain-containing protein [Acidobacteriota bacterium]
QPPRPTPEALQEGAEMLSYFQDALDRRQAPGPFLFGPFTAADVLYAPAVVRLTAFRVPAAHAPKAPAYMEAVLSHPAVRRWMDAARALPLRETY